MGILEIIIVGFLVILFIIGATILGDKLFTYINNRVNTHKLEQRNEKAQAELEADLEFEEEIKDFSKEKQVELRLLRDQTKLIKETYKMAKDAGNMAAGALAEAQQKK